MFHLDNTSGVPEMPEPKDQQSITPKWFGESVEQGGISWPGADWFNIVQAELLNALSVAGISPQKDQFNQLGKAINFISGDSFVSRYGNWATPQKYGAVADGKAASVDALLRMFSAEGISSFYIPQGIYLIDKSLEFYATKNINVVCEAGAVFKLADNIRKDMLLFVGNGAVDFSWSGGEIDGNWVGQGPETTGSDGRINDVSHGIIVSMFNHASLDGLYVHDCMGHHINHGGNVYFKARKIRIKSHISAIYPEGGARGDGITGCSRHVDIEDVEGFSTDDLVAVFSGINWIKGIGTGEARTVESVRVTNIRPKAVYDADGVTQRFTWHACTVGNCYGNRINSVIVDGVKGDCQSAGVRINTYTNANSEYFGSFGSVSVSNINTYVNGKSGGGFTDKLNAAHVCVGSTDPNGVSLKGDKLQYIDAVKISRITMRGSSGSTAGVVVGHAVNKSININDISAVYTNDTDFMSAINVLGQNNIDTIVINGVSQQKGDNVPSSVKRNRMCVTFYYGGEKDLMAYGDGLSSFKNSNNYIGNTLFFAGDLYPNNVALFGYDFVLEAQKNFTSVARQFGVFFTDRYLGRVSRKGKSGGWNFEDWFTTWDSVNFGKPSPANMPGYDNISDFGEGTVVRVIGSLYHECTGWICRSGTPTWQLLSSQFTDTYGDVTPAWSPAMCTPGVEIITFIPYGSSDAWPVSGGGLVRTSVSTSGSGNGTVQEFTPGSMSYRFIRMFQGNAWSAWKKVAFIS
ncbi:pyocin knob domain-containing protein [Pluralibacter gergoviae]